MTSVCCDEEIIFCGYSSGICRLFKSVKLCCFKYPLIGNWCLSVDTGEEITSLDDTSSEISYSNCKVHIGADIIVKISFGYSESENEGRCDIGVWSKRNLKKLFRTVHRNRNMCFFLKVIDNTIIVRWVCLIQRSRNLLMACYREGKNFCKITILEDCTIKYKALRHMEILLKGDFLANNNHIVSRHADRLTVLPFSDSHQAFHVHVTENILDSCLHDDLLFLLHETSVSIYDLASRSWRDKILVMASRLVAIEVNDHVILILDTSNTIHILQLTGRWKV